MKNILAGISGLLGLLIALPAHAGEFQAPSGSLGAGLSTDEAQVARAYIESSFFYRTERDESAFADIKSSVFAFPTVLGGGYKITPDIELELKVPLAYVRSHTENLDCVGADCEISIGRLALGNIFVGGNYLLDRGPLLAKLGAGISYGPWTNGVMNRVEDADGFEENAFGALISYAGSAELRLEEAYLFIPEYFTLYAPARVEYALAPEWLVTGDAGLGLMISTTGDDAELPILLAPGFAYVGGAFTAGARLPLVWFPLEDFAQFALEPYGRVDFGQGFANARFTLNLDDPNGFSFDEGEVWALHVGGGVSF